MSDRANLVRVLTTTTGTGTMALGTAYSVLFMTSSESGMVDGRTYTYLVTEGNDWELGKGVYTASGTTLSRVTVMASRIGGTLGTTKMTLTGTAQVRIVESADDMGALRGTRAVTGISDTLAQSDLGRAVTYSNAASIAVSLAQAGASSSFLDGWSVHVKNTGAGTLTITPTTSTINGGATLVLAQNLGAFIWSDGTNYHAYVLSIVTPVSGPTSSTDNTAARFDSITGKIIQGSALIVADTTAALSRNGAGGVPIQGTNTNDSAAIGDVGEITESEIAVGSAVSLTTATPADITSISLTAGDWDVFGNIGTVNGASTVMTELAGWISTASATAPTSPNKGSQFRWRGSVTGSNGNFVSSVGTRRLSLSGTVTVYLTVNEVFTTSTSAAYGYIGARRVR